MDQLRFLVLNGSSLDLLETHCGWLGPQGIELIGAPSLKKLRPEQLDTLLDGIDAVVGPPAASQVRVLDWHMAAVPTLKVISLASSGYETEDITAATRHGIVISYAPIRSLAEVVADHTWGLLLAAARQIPYHHQLLQAGQGQRGMGAMVWGQTLGIIGLGNIGRCVARRAAGFEMKVLAAEINPDPDYNRRHGIELVPHDELYQRADFISLHVRLTPQNYHLIGTRELSLMKPTAYLINTARQKVVDEVALTEAILNGRIAGAALDDPPEDKDSPLLRLPNVVFTPHIGNRVPESVDAVCRHAYQAAIDVIRGQRRPPFVLNPEVYDSPQLRAPYCSDGET
jgi:phosphoglycerate dehydrogenase-like enzyme